MLQKKLDKYAFSRKTNLEKIIRSIPIDVILCNLKIMIQKNLKVSRIDQPTRYEINYIQHIRSIFEKTRLLQARREKTCIHVEIGNVVWVYNYLLKTNTTIWPSVAGHK